MNLITVYKSVPAKFFNPCYGQNAWQSKIWKPKLSVINK